MGASGVLTSADLLRWRLLGGKVTAALRRIERAVEQHGPCVVCNSTGKDGMVVTALARQVDSSMPISWMDDEIETDETLACLDDIEARWGGVVRLWRPTTHSDGLASLTTWEPERGWFRRPSPGALRVPDGVRTGTWWVSEGRHSLIGTRGGESAVRRRRGHAGPGWTSPIHDWSDEDVWAAIAGLELPVSGVYERLVSAGWPRERCKTVPMLFAAGGSYGPWRSLWPAEVLFAARARRPA